MAITRKLQPFVEAQNALRRRLGNQLPTDTWRDVQREAHDRAFVVAGAKKADLLADLAKAVDDSINKGLGLEYFLAEFDKIIGKHGWAYKGERNWRTRVIYQTNVAVSYAAGRLQQLRDPDLQKLKPFWKYVHSDAQLYPRPLHQSWDGLVLPADHPWFEKHFPPDGWGCGCRVTAVTAREAARAKKRTPPNDGSRLINGREVPNGIDEGWDYMPGNAPIEPKASLPAELRASMAISGRDRFEFSGDADADGEFQTVLDAVKRAHRLPELPKIALRSQRFQPEGGSVRLGEYNHLAKELVIDPSSPVPVRLVLAHEFGHLLHFNSFGFVPGEWPRSMASLARKIRASRKFAELTEAGNAYLLRPEELWARVYSQWLGRFDQGIQTGIDFLRKSNRPEDRLWQWDDDDFEPIAKAIEETLRTRQWLYE
ncbi:hypothetical protein HC761_00525 [bacterium]|nr:hypothetical protein [bacterium]